MADNETVEEKALNKEAERIVLDAFGTHHQNRKSKLGRNLRSWYWLGGFLFVLTCLAYHQHAVYFNNVSKHITKSISQYGVDSSTISMSQILWLYYTSKFGLVMICLIPFLWTLRRITQLQALRSVHADKEALANTLQAILNSQNPTIQVPACDIAVRELFTSAYTCTTAKGKKENRYIKEIKEDMVKIFEKTLASRTEAE